MTDYIPSEVFDDILKYLLPPNRIALQYMEHYGLRIGDCLALKWKDLSRVWHGEAKDITYKEQKTRKWRSFTPTMEDMNHAWAIYNPNSPWVFPGRNPMNHRTRQAVWKDLHQVAALYRVDGKKLVRTLGTHSARKIYAVAKYREAVTVDPGRALDVVRVDLNHRDLAVTFLYALADKITEARVGEKM